MSDKPFTVLAVNCWNEDAETLRQFAGEFKLRYPILMQGGETAQKWGVKGIPDNFLVDPQGKLVATHLDVNEKSLSKVEARIRKLVE